MAQTQFDEGENKEIIHEGFEYMKALPNGQTALATFSTRWLMTWNGRLPAAIPFPKLMPVASSSWRKS